MRMRCVPIIVAQLDWSLEAGCRGGVMSEETTAFEEGDCSRIHLTGQATNILTVYAESYKYSVIYLPSSFVPATLAKSEGANSTMQNMPSKSSSNARRDRYLKSALRDSSVRYSTKVITSFSPTRISMWILPPWATASFRASTRVGWDKRSTRQIEPSCDKKRYKIQWQTNKNIWLTLDEVCTLAPRVISSRQSSELKFRAAVWSGVYPSCVA